MALAIVAIAGLAAVQSFTVATRMAERSRIELALLLSAQELVEEARLETLRPGTSRGDLRQGPFALTWERSVSSTDLAPLQRVHVRVQTADGNAPPVELETYVSGL